MTKEFCLVEVAVRFFKVGEPFWSDQLDEHLWQTEPQVLPIKKATDKNPALWDYQYQTPQDIYFEADNCAFSFRTFGESTSDDWSNAFDWLMDEIGIDEIFEDWLLDLKKIALFILGESNKKKLKKYPQEKPSLYVNFVTAWRYWVSEFHGINGEDYEGKWELLGALDLSKIPFSIMKIEDDNG